MAIDPKRLIELLSIARHGSYTKAAVAQGISQPALSNSIAALEAALGTKVLHRSRRGSELTDVGRLLAGHAEILERVLSRAVTEVRLRKLGLEGSLQIGISPIASVELVPTAVSRLKREKPNILIAIHERDDDGLLKGLRNGELDAVVSPAGPHADSPDLQSEILFRDEPVLIARARSDLLKHKSIKLAMLDGMQWVLPSEHTVMWRYIESMFVAEHVPWPLNLVTTNSISALKSIVMQTDGVSISSRRLVKLELIAGHLSAIPLQTQHFFREIALRTRRTGSHAPLTTHFLEVLRSVAAEMALAASECTHGVHSAKERDLSRLAKKKRQVSKQSRHSK